jgi:hypothetical protein
MAGVRNPHVNGHAERVTPKQEALIAALLTAPTIQDAARTASVAERTAHRWLHEDDAFKAVYLSARRHALRQATARLACASSGAVSVLLQIAGDKCAPAYARVTASRTILEFAYRAEELEDLAARIAALEERMGNHA